jgi:hypothetical protein
MKWGVASGERIVASGQWPVNPQGRRGRSFGAGLLTSFGAGLLTSFGAGLLTSFGALVRCGSPDHAVRVLVRRGSPDHAVRRLRSARVSCIGMVNVVPTHLT